MHLVCLGVMRRLLRFWISGPLKCRLPSFSVKLLSDKLMKIKSFIPTEFARKPRRIDELDRWKATELRLFLLYTGPVALDGILQPEIYSNFMLFFVAIFMLASPKLCLSHWGRAKQLLTLFTDHFAKLYGCEMLVYNVHGLTHLADDVRIHGQLDNFSGFPFENYLGILKKLVRKAHLPLSQVIRRLYERVDLSDDDVVSDPMKKCHSEGPLPLEFPSGCSQFRELFLHNFCIKTSDGNNCAALNNRIVLIRNIVKVANITYLVFEGFVHCCNLFEYLYNHLTLGFIWFMIFLAKLNVLSLMRS
jgi:hypothetical protein